MSPAHAPTTPTYSRSEAQRGWLKETQMGFRWERTKETPTGWRRGSGSLRHSGIPRERLTGKETRWRWEMPRGRAIRTAKETPTGWRRDSGSRWRWGILRDWRREKATPIERANHSGWPKATGTLRLTGTLKGKPRATETRFDWATLKG
jgi:hypothetical protein